MEIKYKNFVDELERIKKEEINVKKLFMKEFLFDIDTELIRLGAIVEENVDPESLNMGHRPGDKYNNSIIRSIHENMKIYWIYKKDCGWYLKPNDHNFMNVEIFEIGFDMKGRRHFSNIIHVTPNINWLNGKEMDYQTLIKEMFDDRKKKAPKEALKRDAKKYNL